MTTQANRWSDAMADSSPGAAPGATYSGDGCATLPRSAGVRSTCHIDILGVRVRVVCTPALAWKLGRLFPVAPAWTRAFQTPPGASVHVRVRSASSGPYELTCDGEPVWQTGDADELAPALEWIVSTAAADRLREGLLLLHSGAVTYGDSGLVFPAASGSGKTTLVAGLLAAGFRYVNDDITAVDPDSHCLVPFATSLCIKEGSWETLARLYPTLAGQVPGRRFGQPVRYIVPSTESWSSRPVPVRYVVAPRYLAGGRTSLAPISRSAGLVRVAQQWFSPPLRRAQDFEGILTMVGQAECYDLVVGDLQQAVALLLELISGAPDHDTRRGQGA
jgi:hypothetical protein